MIARRSRSFQHRAGPSHSFHYLHWPTNEEDDDQVLSLKRRDFRGNPISPRLIVLGYSLIHPPRSDRHWHYSTKVECVDWHVQQHRDDYRWYWDTSWSAYSTVLNSIHWSRSQRLCDQDGNCLRSAAHESYRCRWPTDHRLVWLGFQQECVDRDYPIRSYHFHSQQPSHHRKRIELKRTDGARLQWRTGTHVHTVEIEGMLGWSQCGIPVGKCNPAPVNRFDWQTVPSKETSVQALWTRMTMAQVKLRLQIHQSDDCIGRCYRKNDLSSTKVFFHHSTILCRRIVFKQSTTGRRIHTFLCT